MVIMPLHEFPRSPPLCIDIYHGNEVSDWSKVKEFGINFVFHKVSEGLDNLDPLFALRRKMSADDGIEHWGGYHFFHGHTDPVKEAEDFIKGCGDLDGLALALDWERLRDGSYGSAPQAAQFVERVLELSGRDNMWIYGGDVLKEAIHGTDAGAKAYWSQFKLWLCQYGPHFIMPLAWLKPTGSTSVPDLWQNNGDQAGPGPHRIPGIPSYCDNSCLVGTNTVEGLAQKWAE
jgi:lysozyme